MDKKIKTEIERKNLKEILVENLRIENVIEDFDEYYDVRDSDDFSFFSEEEINVEQLSIKNPELGKKILKGIRKMLHREIQDWLVSPLQKKQTTFNKKSAKNISSMHSEIEYLRDTIHAVKDVLNSFEKKIDVIQPDLEKIIDVIQPDLEKKIDAIQPDLDKKIDAIQPDLEKKIDAIQPNLDKKIDAIQSDLDKKIDAIRSDLDKKIDYAIKLERSNNYKKLGRKMFYDETKIFRQKNKQEIDNLIEEACVIGNLEINKLQKELENGHLNRN